MLVENDGSRKQKDFPGETPFTHGDSYQKAAKAGEEVLELLLS